MVRHFAARGRVGDVLEEVVSKQGLRHVRRSPATGATREVLSLGGACSECYSGPRLARVLQPALAMQQEALASLARGEPSRVLSQHTSAGAVTGPLNDFLSELGMHLPWTASKDEEEPEAAAPEAAAGDDGDDWFVSLQTEGASAVWAACDLLLQAQHRDNASLLASERRKVGVGARSYHGPGATSFGSMAPLGRSMKPMQVQYPVPSVLPAKGDADPGSDHPASIAPRRPGEPVEAFEARASATLEAFLAAHAHEVGVLLVEPQWGSSLAAQPWPAAVLSSFVRSAQERYGMLVCADEIMCGLGRHGQLQRGGGGGEGRDKGRVSTFLSGSDKMDFVPDAVTFGKAVAGGCGDVLAGVAVRRGRKSFHDSHRSALQVHTYAGASARALVTAREVLRELRTSDDLGAALAANAGVLGAALGGRLARESRGAITVHGQGLMWGGLFAHPERETRRAAASRFAARCADAGVAAYPVPEGGFMVTPVYDAEEADLEEAAGRLVDAALRTCEDMGWDESPPPGLGGAAGSPGSP